MTVVATSSPRMMSKFRLDVIVKHLLLVETTTPLDGVARVTEGLPIQTSVVTMAGIALECIRRWLHHVRCGPIHVGLCEPVLTAVFQTGDRRGNREGMVPVKVRPETIFTRCDWL